MQYVALGNPQIQTALHVHLEIDEVAGPRGADEHVQALAAIARSFLGRVNGYGPERHRDGEPMFNALLTAQKQWEPGFIGAPWEPMLLSDIDDPRMKDYRVYIFLNTLRVTPTERAANSRETQEERATALWVYATGYIGDKADVANISALTGIKRAQNMAPGELHVDVINREHPITKGLKEKLAYGTDERVQEIRRPPAASAG
jgi:hypothetical protein